MISAIILPFVVVIILVVYIFILSFKYKNFCNYEVIVPAVGKNAISFIQLGSYTLSGVINPTRKYKKRITIIGTANIESFHFKGLNMIINFNAFKQNGDKAYSIERHVIFSPNKDNKVFCVSFEYFNNELETVQTGAAEKILPTSLECSFHSSLTSATQFHKDTHLFINALKNNRYSWKVYNLRRENKKLLEYIEFRHQ